MRYDAEHKQKTRQRLLEAAAKMLREEGPHRLGVAAVMGEAGLTHGGFYAHFRSKDDLVAEGIEEIFRQSRKQLERRVADASPREGLASYVDFYLSPAHRDARSSGCALPFLSADAPRLPESARARFADGVARLEAALARTLAQMDVPEPEAEASSLVAELCGALALARAEPDRARADLMLQRSRERIFRRYGLTAPPASP
jgi:TetR/AcrR family transcriptional repressor of nem operon